MNQPTLFSQQSVAKKPDICRNRHGGAETSQLADKRVAKERDRMLVYGYVKASGLYGMTLDEVSIVLDRAPNRISGRFSELKRSGQIMMTHTTRLTRTKSSARVYVAADL